MVMPQNNRSVTGKNYWLVLTVNVFYEPSRKSLKNDLDQVAPWTLSAEIVGHTIPQAGALQQRKSGEGQPMASKEPDIHLLSAFDCDTIL